MKYDWDPYRHPRAPYSERNQPPRRGLIQRCAVCGRAWNVSWIKDEYICMECDNR